MKIKHLSDCVCPACPYDGNKCEEQIAKYPQFGVIKDMIYHRENYDYQKCSLFNFIKDGKR